MGNRAFGRIVRTLRHQRWFFDAQGNPRAWTRERLAQATTPQIGEGKTGLTAKQVADIESGRVANLKPDLHLEPLARAFKFDDAAKAEFYAAAGWLYTPPNTFETDHDLVRWLLEQIPYPATAFTPLSDIIAFNEGIYQLYGHSPATLAAMDTGEVGPNILRLYLDPLFRMREFFGGDEPWRAQVMRTIRVFRTTALRHMATSRYREIIDGMRQYQDFERLWELSEFPPDDARTPISPTLTTFNPAFGDLTFLMLRVPPSYIGRASMLSVHVPADPSADGQRRLLAQSASNQIYFFRDQPLR